MRHDFTKDLPLWSEPEAQAVLTSICAKHGVDPDILRELVRIEREYQHMGRAHGIYEEFDDALSRMA